MKLKELKQELINHARTLIPKNLKDIIRIPGLAKSNSLVIETTSKRHIESKVLELFGIKTTSIQINKNLDISGILELESFSFPIEKNNEEVQNLSIDKTEAELFQSDIEKLESNFKIALAQTNTKLHHIIKAMEAKSHSQKYWVEKTIVKGRPDREKGNRALGKAIWSPRKDKRGADIYKNMRLVKPGDLIIHLVDNSFISGISIAKTKTLETDGVSGTDWDGESYLVELSEYEELKSPIERSRLLNPKYHSILSEISEVNEVFYTKQLSLRQGAYLTPCPLRLAALINSIYVEQESENLPHFDIHSLDFKTEFKDFETDEFLEDLNHSGLLFQKKIITRFIASLLTKPFVLLSGLSGSGKTKLAQSFAMWICEDDTQYCIVAVGADWTNREPLLGYVNALDTKEYVLPENGALQLLINANENQEKPYFLILDEMNLSHVERYFADFLSVMESKEEFKLHSSKTNLNKTDSEKFKNSIEVPNSLSWPKNLYVVGTVNIDETTYMFSPKVLDRANAIEFRINESDIETFLNSPNEIDLKQLESKGAAMGTSFIEMAKNKTFEDSNTTSLNKTLVNFFAELKKTGAEFGYRSGMEIHRLYQHLTVLDSNLSENDKIDIALMQKLLPKLHGSQRKLCPILITLGKLCVNEADVKKDFFENKEMLVYSGNPVVLYPLSLEKITRMYKGAIDNGFASYAEA